MPNQATLNAVRPQAPSPQTPLEEVQLHVRSGELENGFRYAIVPFADGSGCTDIVLEVNVGESEGIGPFFQVPHILEHVLLRRFRSPSGGTISYAELERLWNVPLSINGNTGDITKYRFKAPDWDVPNALHYMRDVAGKADLDPYEIDLEARVVRSELLLKFAWGSDLFIPKFSSGGETRTPEDMPRLANIDTAGAIEFYKTWYKANLQTIYAVGDFDAGSVERQIREVFADLPGNGIQPRPWAPPADLLEGPVDYDVRQRTVKAGLLLDYEYDEEFGEGEEAHFAERAVRAVLESVLRALLLPAAGAPRELLSFEISSDSKQYRRAPKGIDIRLATPAGSFSPVMAHIAGVMRSLAEGGVTDAYFEEIKSSMMDYTPESRDQDTTRSAMQVTRGLQLAAKAGRFGEIHRHTSLTKPDLEAVTVESIRAEMDRLLRSVPGFYAMAPGPEADLGLLGVKRLLENSSPVAVSLEQKQGQSLPSTVARIPAAPAVKTDVPAGKGLFRLKNATAAPIFFDGFDETEHLSVKVVGPGMRQLPANLRVPAGSLVNLAVASGFAGVPADAFSAYLAGFGGLYQIEIASHYSVLTAVVPAESADRIGEVMHHLVQGPTASTAVRSKMEWDARWHDSVEGSILDTIVDRAIGLDLPAPDSWAAAQPLLSIPSEAQASEIWARLFRDPGAVKFVVGGKGDAGTTVAAAASVFENLAPLSLAGDAGGPGFGGRNVGLKRGYGAHTSLRALIPLQLGHGDDQEEVMQALSVAFEIGGTRFRDRLRVVEAGAYVPHVSVIADPERTDRVFLVPNLLCHPGDAARLLDAVWDEISDVQRKGLSLDETRRVSSLKETEGLLYRRILKAVRAAPDSGEVAVSEMVKVSGVDVVRRIIATAKVDDMLVFEVCP